MPFFYIAVGIKEGVGLSANMKTSYSDAVEYARQLLATDPKIVRAVICEAVSEVERASPPITVTRINKNNQEAAE